MLLCRCSTVEKIKKVLDKAGGWWYNKIKIKEREDNIMTKTIVTAYGKENEIIKVVETTYDNRYDIMNKLFKIDGVVAVHTATKLK